MDSCGFAIVYGATISTTLMEKQTTHYHYMGLLCTFEFLFNTSKGKFKFKFKLKPIGTIKMCCLLSK
jgi:hypothetical protein